ncbi:BZ3500_MvSof-1268-A1-R1_Chr8-1g10023 [Microbotryum saponariae]|uniref:BZ3500_MvSof-1268-A1-R1_Chr8-1g10023 protein n=1 Tax=Microbotryum saponariae TaxID=289078 RepID=A0A2X0LQS9_9BASI|nr:BZ3500_MvSof-1268-A1-R1_Chr8-1g10023 [Microbotryum saponariae]SDA08309.1 BZ3501_MvSof-1269-A2-R1_Chr8-1g09746 [Microbotryum saponariae]
MLFRGNKSKHVRSPSFAMAFPESTLKRKRPLGIPRITFVRIELDRRRALVLPVLRLFLPGAGPALPQSRLLSSHMNTEYTRRDSIPDDIIEMRFTRTLLVVVASWIVFVGPLILLVLTVRLAFRSKKVFKTIFTPEEIERIWRWEIASGHYPSAHPIDITFGTHSHQRGIVTQIPNPARPFIGSDNLLAEENTGLTVKIVPTGPSRFYLVPEPLVQIDGKAYLSRPASNAALDMDQVMEHCEFPKGYVRDCLTFLRGESVDIKARRRYFTTEEANSMLSEQVLSEVEVQRASMGKVISVDSNVQFERKLQTREQLSLASLPMISSPLRQPHATFPNADIACDPEHPRLLHMYWTGPFTDKPYMAVISFLYTQNLGLNIPLGEHPSKTHCRPQLWIWINPVSAATLLPPEDAAEQIQRDLEANKWSSALLHPRWRDVVHFKLWNTSQQLDNAEELNGWREMNLFNSHGYKYKQDTVKKPNEEFRRVGTTDSSHYDRLSVVMSDMARFLLLHQYGGMYVDADTIFLRDWEPLFSWRGAFAYRWSRLNLYNTAVLKMDRKTALSHFIVRTSVENGFDFHPMSVAHYTQNAKTRNLLKMLPDALFDPAWLNTENFQRDRPAQPYFKKFEDFFQPPKKGRGGPATFDSFFKGAFSYHYHNFWWQPFDPVRNYPDLDPKVERASLSGQEQGEMSWSTMLKRHFEAFIRAEERNMYGEMIDLRPEETDDDDDDIDEDDDT